MNRRKILLGAGALAASPVAVVRSEASEQEEPESTESPRSEYPFDKFVGMNGFIDDPVEEVLAGAGHLREYHNWTWNEPSEESLGYPDNEIKFNPAYAGGGWDFDQYYQDTADAGIDVTPCIQGSVNWLHDGWHGSRKPVYPKDADPTDPASYEPHAHFMFQYAARYGSTEVDTDLLTLADDQEEKTGLGLISSIENWNEPNNDWSHPEAWFEPEEFAAMTSADYDGHEGELGDSFGVKNADPDMTFVLGGTAGMPVEYFERMVDWFEENRDDQQFAADAINVHHYTRDGNPETPALSPEADDVKGRMEDVVQFKDERVPDAEVWITEFGWDTHPESNVRPVVNDPYDIYDVQAQWLARSYLEYSAAGADRATMYMSRDVDSPDATQYATSGLTDGKWEWNKRPSWYYVASLGHILDGHRFVEEVSSGHDDVIIYRYETEDPETITLAIWSATSVGQFIEEFPVRIPNYGQEEVTVIELSDGSTTGEERTLDVTPGKSEKSGNDGSGSGNPSGENWAHITVSESPKFVQFKDVKSTSHRGHN